MSFQASIPLFILIGAVSGAVTGFFGLAGGLIIIPALVYLSASHSRRRQGQTSLSFYCRSVLLPLLNTTGTATLTLGPQ